MASVVEVKLELGHRAKVRDVPSLEGHTHDWVLFVKGSEGIKLEYFVEKVVFWLHESYDPSRRVIKTPPYRVEQSGFAGFNMLIDIHFRNKEDPKMVRFEYDLFLHTESMPPVNHTRLEKLTFTNPTKDFREKLLSAGAMLIETDVHPKHASKDQARVKHSTQKAHHAKSKSSDDRGHEKRFAGRKQGPQVKSSGEFEEKAVVAKTGSAKQTEEHSKQHKRSSAHGNTNRSSDHGLTKFERDKSGNESSLNPEKGSSKKKKKGSDDSISKMTSSSKSTSKKKEKRKIKTEKPDVMSGLFAPENSINMNQIKHSKGKKKLRSEQEAHRKRDKDEISTKHSQTATKEDPKPPRRSITPSEKPHKSTTESNTESPGNAKLVAATKVKKEPKSSHVEDQRMGSDQQMKRYLPVSLESSSSNSDMDISDGDVYKSSSEIKKVKPTKRKHSRSEPNPPPREALPKDLDDTASHHVKQKRAPKDEVPPHPLEKRAQSKDRLGSSKKSGRSAHAKTDEKSSKRSDKHGAGRSEPKRHKKMKETSPRKDSSRQSGNITNATRGRKEKSRKSASKSRSPNDFPPVKTNVEVGKKRQEQTGANTHADFSDEIPYLPTFDDAPPVKIAKTITNRPNKGNKVYKSSSFVETSSDDDSDADSIVEKTEPEKLHKEKLPSLSPAPNSGIISDGDGSVNADLVLASGPLHSQVASSDEYAEEHHQDVAYPALKDMQMSDSSSNGHSPDSPAQDRPRGDLFQEFDAADHGNTSSSEEESYAPENPFQNSQEGVKDSLNFDSREEHLSSNPPDVKVRIGSEKKQYPHLTESLHQRLQELQRKLAYVRNTERLKKIVSIVAKSQTYVMNAGYFDFDLCSLDAKTIQKIEKHLIAD